MEAAGWVFSWDGPTAFNPLGLGLATGSVRRGG